VNLTLHVWRQRTGDGEGGFVQYEARDISPDASFLEMLDIVNEQLIEKGDEPIHFEHDCREGICGACGMMINGIAHGPMGGTATCQLHMRHFEDGDVVRHHLVQRVIRAYDSFGRAQSELPLNLREGASAKSAAKPQ